jgi:hypothetical protein
LLCIAVKNTSASQPPGYLVCKRHTTSANFEANKHSTLNQIRNYLFIFTATQSINSKMVSVGRKSLVFCAAAIVAFAGSVERVAAVDVTQESVMQIIEELSPVCQEELKHTFAGGVSYLYAFWFVACFDFYKLQRPAFLQWLVSEMRRAC